MSPLYEEFILRAEDGTPLQCACWAATEPRAALLLLHGVASHLRWYAPLAETLADNGITVVVADRRGCGRSGGRRGDAPSAAALLRDVQLAAAALRERAPGVPQHLCGVSLGALLAAVTVMETPATWSSLILITPALRLATPLTKWQCLRLGVASVLCPSLSFPMPYGANALARTADWQDALDSDPLRITRITARFGRITMVLQHSLPQQAAKLHAPILLQLAGDDRVIDNAAARSFFEASASQRRRVETYEGAPHGLPLSLARGRLEAQICAWIFSESALRTDAAISTTGHNGLRHVEATSFARDETGLLRRPGSP